MRQPDKLIYLEIAESVRRLIISGELKPGEQLPPIRQQAKHWGCTPGTVSRAYAALAEEGLVTGRSGAGTRVTESALQAAPTTWRWASLVNLAEKFLLDAVRSGHTASQVEAALSAAVTRWQEVQAASAAGAPSLAPESELRFVGSHDLVIESLPRLLAHRRAGLALSLRYAGSLGGLMAMARGEADLVGTHLWDAISDVYNVPFVERVLPGRRLVLLTLFHRSMGLIVPTGNPQRVRGLADLAGPGVRFVNRQAGSGTRVWLDAQLKALGIAREAIAGYQQTVVTHEAVARAVAENTATAGLGIQAAALAHGLDFVPLTQERYDLVFPEAVWNSAAGQLLVAVIRSSEFRETVLQLQGYDLTAMGQETWLQ